jgi:hypothetical protein
MYQTYQLLTRLLLFVVHDPVHRYFTTVGKRAFDVYLENSLIAASFDPTLLAGPKSAAVLERVVNVTDGVVTIELVKKIENPAISGIEIIATIPSQFATRINVGGGAFVDSTGKTWIADNYFEGKGAAYGACPRAIANTVDGGLYCTNRWFAPWHVAPFLYQIPVPAAAVYQVRLHFAEIVSCLGAGKSANRSITTTAVADLHFVNP